MITGSRGGASLEAEPRLPRPPGVLRRFWARHPVLADITIAGFCLLLSVAPVIALPNRASEDGRLDPETWDRVWPVLASVVVLGCFALLARRRNPVAVFTITVVVAAVYLFSPVALGGPLVGIATYAVAVYRGNRTCLIAVGAGFSFLLVVAGALGVSGVIAADIAWNVLISEALMMVIGGLIGANVGGRKRYVEALIAHSRRLVVERDQQTQLAASAERERIARELHDIVAHSLTVMVALAEGVAASKDAAHSRPGAEAIAVTGREALRDMRATLGVLRDTDAAPLAPLARDTTDETVASARAAGYETRLTVTGEPDVPSATRLAVSRIVQEGVTNVLRHARAAARIDVEIRYAEDGVSVSIVDDGRTAEGPSGGGFGLRGVRERVELVGGTVTAGPGEPRGWAVRAWLPRKEEE
ncbi:sensor histidine kinase [Microbacterium sp. NPDC077663]|uniref:sensor histidine kinase n=1 Tax=Microbacterium sp. NPDC077663 TaxID=3364189 RepID=UPI0037CB924E